MSPAGPREPVGAKLTQPNPASTPRRQPAPITGIYLVTDRHLTGDRGLLATVDAAVAGGVTTVQYREKRRGAEDQLRDLERLAEVIDGRATLIINDRLDVAIAARKLGIRLDGVHLGQGDAAVHEARDALGADAIVGLTANTTAHLAAVAALPAGTVDYLGIGVIRPTSTKPDHPPALGVDGFAALAAATPLPAVAIGGIHADDVAPLREAGAAAIAVVSAICAAPDPSFTARGLTAAWHTASTPTRKAHA
ncbi:thiamine phosphate synthase [Gulosibacter sp. ACHW.36C]|uniref:Thiamine-phosphate synthase n=1 Tax=Gulosibacter sediminis TaxID=1729695 RepID=A0ABY4MV07_9MICO|nr:thiamine phosphate synthase [Gulosibacter sediminis]UQN14255.1 thiamine phosphate synthase [Gulosibacter sediminis]